MVIKKIGSTILVASLTLSITTTSTSALAATETNENPSIELYGSDVYDSLDQQIDRNSIKYGLLEVRNKTLQTNAVELTYYTHYSLNQSSATKNAQFNFTIDTDLTPYVDHVLVRTTKGDWIKASKLNNHTYSVKHASVLKTGLIGVNQQFDVKVVLKDHIANLPQTQYTFDIALVNNRDEAISSTMDGTLLDRNAEYNKVSESNRVTASGFTVKSSNPDQNEIILDYMMHYKLNNASDKNGQFKFEIDQKLLPYVEDVQVQTTDGRFKSVSINPNGKFSYAAKGLVSHSKIGVRQHFEVKLILKDQSKYLPSGLYQFSAYQTDGNSVNVLENTNNTTYFTR